MAVPADRRCSNEMLRTRGAGGEGRRNAMRERRFDLEADCGGGGRHGEPLFASLQGLVSNCLCTAKGANWMQLYGTQRLS
jgi:hypothetical protein